MKPVLIGAHFSIAGGLHKAFDHADKYNCTAMQIFTQNSHTWKLRKLSEKEIITFSERRKLSGVKEIIAHTGYLINLAGSDPEKREKSMEAMKGELLRADQLGIKNVVLHPGSHTKTSITDGIKRLQESINALFSDKSSGKASVLFETTAGQGDSIGHRLEDIQKIIEKIENKKRIGLCIDTCHVFAAGYDISTIDGYNSFVNEIERRFGIASVKCIHLNDSKKKAGSKIDRHENIGMGFIGDKTFEIILNDQRFAHASRIIETPQEKEGLDMNQENFKRLRSFLKPEILIPEKNQ